MKKPSAQPTPRRTKSADSTTTAAPSININDPRHRRAVSAIPFSWEQHPGIAKPTTETKPVTKPSTETKAITKPTVQAKASTPDHNVSRKSLLPPPPPISLSNVSISVSKKSNSTTIMITDPFEIALAECAKVPPTPPGLMEEIWGCKMAEPQRARWRFGLACNVASACSIVDSKVHVPRAGIQTASCRILSHGRLM